MGLLYLFPIDETETDYVKPHGQGILVKSYGLPLIFWSYAGAIFMVLGFMYLAIHASLKQLITYDSTIDHLIYYSVMSLFIFTPVILLGFFFFEKSFIKEKNQLMLVYKVFGIKFFTKKLQLKSSTSLQIGHFLDSPNMARLQGHQNPGFQNKGYFELMAECENGKLLVIDRCSKKVDLAKLQELLTKY